MEPSPPATQGEYLAPDPHPASGRNWKAAGGTAVGIAAVLAKLKGLFFIGKFGLTALSFLASIWFYALFFGWRFGAVFVALIAVHELGHAAFVRSFRIATPAIYFVPGFGAFTTWDARTTPVQSSTIALGGPLLGALGSLACLGAGIATGQAFWLAAAYTGFFLNLFNLVPLGIFDGAKIVAIISSKLWLAGLAICIALVVALHWWNPIVIIVILLSIPQTIAAWRGTSPAPPAPMRARAAIAAAYFGLIALLGAGMAVAKIDVPVR